MIAIPPMPEARDERREGRPSHAELSPRYEDITQDGRHTLTPLVAGVSATVWRSLLADAATLTAFRTQGVVPILRRMVLVAGEPGPFTVGAPVSFEGHVRLAREENGDRLFVNMWVDARAPIGHTHAPAPAVDAPRVLVARMFAEHVLTRLFAAPEDRKVTRLDVEGWPEVPEDTHRFEPAEALTVGRSLEAAAGFRFGMMHTDGNQHVNSLVYPRVFEETALQKLGDAARIARAVELRWRKPFFAGDLATIALAADGDMVFGTFTPEATPDRPSCAVAMRLG